MSHSTRRSLPLMALVVILLTSLLPAAGLAQGPDGFPASAPAAAPDLTNSISLNLLGRYAGIGAEIAAHDPATKRLYVTGPQLQIVDISNPVTPMLVSTVPIEATSVAVRGGIIAAAVPAHPVQDPGRVVFLTPDGVELTSVTVGALPDMPWPPMARPHGFQYSHAFAFHHAERSFVEGRNRVIFNRLQVQSCTEAAACARELTLL